MITKTDIPDMAICRKCGEPMKVVDLTVQAILRWHGQLVAAKWDYHEKRQPGRPRVTGDITELVLKMAKENPAWGYDRIQGVLANLGHEVSDTTVGNLLKANGIEPAPDRQRKSSWKTFLKAHWEVLAPWTSRRSRCGPKAAWRLIICCSPCGWRHGGFALPA